jgi:hypothetical protein
MLHSFYFLNLRLRLRLSLLILHSIGFEIGIGFRFGQDPIAERMFLSEIALGKG